MAAMVQYMMGLSLLIFGISLLLRPADWTAWMQALAQRGRAMALTIGSVTLLFGAFIVAFHPIWHGIPMLLTIIGWLAVLEGAVYLLFPQALAIVLRFYLKCPKLALRIGGVLSLAIGLALLYVRQAVMIG